ncbi:MAG TPA: OB-fold nucleic acid binding domain-containing protein [Mycobacteriales bacterium]|jgi:RecG-like helicase|nr:OB-fold nucleic acid binding domain-containing protein [Mycobacteriales bacterium]
MGEHKGGLRGMLHRIAASDSAREAEGLQEQSEREGATAVRRCRQGAEVCVAGTVRAVRLAPLAGAPTFEVDLYDGSGTVRLVFLGRRAIAGIEAGHSLIVHGRLTRREGRSTIFNPRYELVTALA